MIAGLYASLAMLGSAAQRLVCELSKQRGLHVGLLLTALITALATIAAAAFLGAWIASLVIGQARAILVAAALILAGVMMFRSGRIEPLIEPTRSLGAIGLVLFAKQVADPARWVIFASAAALSKTDHAMLGGGLSAVSVLIVTWWLSDRVSAFAHYCAIRKAIGALFFLSALFIGLIGGNLILHR